MSKNLIYKTEKHRQALINAGYRVAVEREPSMEWGDCGFYPSPVIGYMIVYVKNKNNELFITTGNCYSIWKEIYGFKMARINTKKNKVEEKIYTETRALYEAMKMARKYLLPKIKCNKI